MTTVYTVWQSYSVCIPIWRARNKHTDWTSLLALF